MILKIDVFQFYKLFDVILNLLLISWKGILNSAKASKAGYKYVKHVILQIKKKNRIT